MPRNHPQLMKTKKDLTAYQNSRIRAYNRHASKAVKMLDVAKIYLEDGAPFDAARAASEAVVEFFKAGMARNALIKG